MRPGQILTVILLSLCVFAFTSFADSTSPPRIAKIHLNGNRVTKPEVIRHFLRLDTGMVADSSMLADAKRRLETTNLFAKVALIPLVKDEGIDLYVIVKEIYYFGPPSLDLTPYTSRYGRSGWWFSPLLGIEHSNFRGRKERLRLVLRGPEWQTVSVGWSKPLFPSPYFIGMSALYDARPDNALPLDRFEIAGSFTAGRRVGDHSKIYASIIPDYQRKKSWLNPTDTLNSSYYQAFGSIGFYTDHRLSHYDPSGGWLFQLETRSNHLYVRQPILPYVQLFSNLQFYHRGFSSRHKLAYRATLISRTNDAGIQNRLTLGGTNSVRGYANGGIDLQRESNGSLALSMEYRFPLFQFSSTPLVLPESVCKTMERFLFDPKDLVPRIDGALILDYGRVGRYFEDVLGFESSRTKSGFNAGAGIRIMEPLLRQSACFDVVWIEDPRTSRFDMLASPSLNLYLNLPF